mmetsp:Transcript_6019/g.14288  ORF Transcript_6019/g.14288 Transcript_6019/m.14288 type:complete len:158 (-) Transcript_6019:209-682(-)
MGKRSKECAEEEVDEEEQPTKKLQTEPPEYEDPALDNDEGEPTEFSVSIGGLSFETKRKALRKACAKFGEVVTVRRWVRGAPRRADVSFSSAEEMEAAIQGMEGKEIDGRTVKVKATPKEEEAAGKKKGKGKGKGGKGKGKGKGKSKGKGGGKGRGG